MIVVKMKMYLHVNTRRGSAWCLRVTARHNGDEVVVKTWFSEYSSPTRHPPYHETFPVARICERVARQWLMSE